MSSPSCPEELFGDDGALVPELAALAPDGDLRMGSLPHANGGRVTAGVLASSLAAP